MSYREYFDIDPDYFPQVDKKIIEEHPDLWKKSLKGKKSYKKLLRAL